MVTKVPDQGELRALRGTKRTCQNTECEARFYDLNRDPDLPQGFRASD
jgi:Protein of unknown function (FYDLN_acid)